MRHIFELVQDICSTVCRWICGMFLSFVQDETWLEEKGFRTFVVSEYLDRMEKASLEILEQRVSAEKVIILWWGLDGLRLNEDGTLEWISKKKPEPVNQSVFYQPPCQMMERTNYPLNYMNMQQSQQAAMSALQFQADRQTQNAAMIAALQSCCATPYPYYYYGRI